MSKGLEVEISMVDFAVNSSGRLAKRVRVGGMLSKVAHLRGCSLERMAKETGIYSCWLRRQWIWNSPGDNLG